MSNNKSAEMHLNGRCICSWILPVVLFFCQPLLANNKAAILTDNKSVDSIVSIAAVANNAELDQLRQKFRDGKILEAHMRHEFLDSYTGESQVTQGKIWISQKKYKIEAEEQVVVVDGETSRVYNERQNKLVISLYEPANDDFAPSRFFSDEEELYHVSEVIREENTTTFVLKTEDAFEIFLEVRIILDKNLKPFHINAVDQMENVLKTTLTEARFLEYNDDLFQLEYPADAELIDLRK